VLEHLFILTLIVANVADRDVTVAHEIDVTGSIEFGERLCKSTLFEKEKSIEMDEREVVCAYHMECQKGEQRERKRETKKKNVSNHIRTTRLTCRPPISTFVQKDAFLVVFLSAFESARFRVHGEYGILFQRKIWVLNLNEKIFWREYFFS
jgi:hypothetical protein